MTGRGMGLLALVAATIGLGPAEGQETKPQGRIVVNGDGDRVTVSWPTAPGESARLTLNVGRRSPLIERVELVEAGSPTARTLLKDVNPVATLVVGSRVNPPPIPPEMSVFNVFFDSPAQRPHQTYRVGWSSPRPDQQPGGPERKTVRLTNDGERASVALGPIEAGPFRGEWVISVYAGSRLLRVEAVLKTDEQARAITYDAGMVQADPRPDQAAPQPLGKSFAWIDPKGEWHHEPANPAAPDTPHAVRHRTLLLEGLAGGTVACFPAPHQFFFPRDMTDNLATTWTGTNHRGLTGLASGFGIRQPETGGGNYAPWFNAPPGTDQRLGVFYLLHPGNAEATMAEVLKFTHGDRYPAIPGHKTFSSHYHIAFTVEAMKQKAQGIDPPQIPPLVGVFKGLGVDAVHVAEFHGDGLPLDPGPVRLAELQAMFSECRRISDDQLLVIPGEEANLYLGHGVRSGHWLEMFPKPVPFTMRGPVGQPLETNGVYHLKTAADLQTMLQREHGLAWTAHPRIKASNFAPDIYKDDPFFRDPTWLGASWKAMPADLSRPRLGDRCLDLLDAMSNWGAHKQLLGEVDTFKTDSTHEMYGHMNVNYIRLDHLPRFDDGWQPILDALRAGQFFTTTGEVLLHSAQLGGHDFGSTLTATPTSTEVQVDAEWTFPLAFAEVVSGDGEHVYRNRLELNQTPAFGRQTLTLHPDLTGRKWARFAVWDIAANGAFTQPIWLDTK